LGFPTLLISKQQELLKHTPSTNEDFTTLSTALKDLQAAANQINERKRLIENVQKLLEIQQTLVGLVSIAARLVIFFIF